MRNLLMLLSMAFLLCATKAQASGTEGHEEESLDMTHIISHHISDSHSWNVFSYESEGQFALVAACVS